MTTERAFAGKTRRHARREYLMERSGVSWNATAECGGGSGKGGGKNTTRSAARCGDFFQAACYTLVRYAFSCISKRGRNTFLPALFSVGRLSAALGITRTSSVLLSFARQL